MEEEAIQTNEPHQAGEVVPPQQKQARTNASRNTRKMQITDQIQQTPQGNPIILPHGILYPLTEISDGVFQTQSGRTINSPHVRTVQTESGETVGAESINWLGGSPWLYCRTI